MRATKRIGSFFLALLLVSGLLTGIASADGERRAPLSPALAVLSLTGARTAMNLSAQHAAETQSYYEADASAQRYLAELLESGADGAYTQSFSFGDGMVLQLEATLDAGALNVTRYSVQAPEAEINEDFLELWDE